MTGLLHNLLLCTVSGSLMFGLGTLINLRFSKHSMSRWYYGVIVMSLIMLLIPFGYFDLMPRLIRVTIPNEITTALTAAPNNTAAPTRSAAHGITPISVITGTWLSVALVLGVRAVCGYAKARRIVSAISRPCTDPAALRMCESLRVRLRVHRKVRVMVSGSIASPLLFGIIKPRIIIPDKDFDKESLKLIFAHELTHLKHHDLTVKLLSTAAGCVHWFNPVMYPLRRSLNTVCELCCDESVLRRLNLSDNKDYGRLIISVIEDSVSGLAAYSTSMASAKKHMKRRLSRIARFKEITGALRTVSLAVAAALAVCSLTAFGFSYAAEIAPDEISKVLGGGGSSVISKFSAAPASSAVPAPNGTEASPDEPTAAPVETQAAPENSGYDGLYEQTEPQSGALLDGANPTPEYENRQESETTPPVTEAPPAVVTEVQPAPAPTEKAAVSQPPEPTVKTVIAETLKIPAVSSYVLSLVCDEGGNASTPVLEATKTATVDFTLINPVDSVEVLRCDPSGGNAEPTYEDADNLSGFRLPVSEGECFRIVFMGGMQPGGTNTLIIK